MLTCGYRIVLEAAPSEIWPALARIGGKNGYYYADGLWRLRAWLDRWAGGPGFKPKRPHPEKLAVGDALDFWRVLEVVPPRCLLLGAEMKLPGEATLEFSLSPEVARGTELSLLARFLPRGLSGRLYWFALEPFHHWVYQGMLKAIARHLRKPIISEPERHSGRKTQVTWG